MYFFSILPHRSSISPLSVDELVFEIIQLLSSSSDCPTKAFFMAYKFYKEICLNRQSKTY